MDIRFLKIIIGSTPGNGGVNDILFNCNDGGISKTVNGKDWLNINGTGLAISQCWGLGISNLKHDLVCSGMQDDNVFTFTDGNWYRVGNGGDGGKVAIDRNDPKHIYNNSWSTSVYLQESIDGGLNNWTQMPAPSAIAPINNRHILVHNNNVLYTANHDVYKYIESSRTWKQISDLTTSCTLPTSYKLNTFVVAPSDPNFVYATTGGPTWDPPVKWVLFKGTNVESAIPTWTDITNNCGDLQWRYITSIEIDPNNPNRVWLSLNGGKVDYSSDGGTTWSDFSIGLPNLTINKLIYQNGSDYILYAATDGGVYYYDKTSGIWQLYNSGLPNCIVQELAIDYYNGQIIAATHGRGVCISPLVNLIYNEFSMTLSKSVTWDKSYAFGASITVPVGKTLTITKDLALKPGSKILVQSGGSLIITGCNIIMTDGNPFLGITVENGGFLSLSSTSISAYDIDVKTGGTLRIIGGLTITGNHHIDIESGGYICIDNGITINLTDQLSAINLHNGYHLGVNTTFFTDPGTCMSTIVKNGIGNINLFNNNLIIQKEILTGIQYRHGNNISAGTLITVTLPGGPVTIKNGANVTFDADGIIVLDWGFEVENGALFEAK